MCTVSMIMDHYREKWDPLRRYPYTQPYIQPFPVPVMAPTTTTPNPITDEEIAEFRRLLERAREYDKRNNEPDCELDEKRLALLTLAKELGIDISFIEKPV